MSCPPTITAAIITLNEQRQLPGLLNRLDWVDEIVVVDGGSQDATVQIARSHGCRVVSRAFDTFADQRNYALRLATGDWILSIDADERPTPRLAAEIVRRISAAKCRLPSPRLRGEGPGVRGLGAGSNVNAFRIPIRSTIFGRQVRLSGTQDDCPVRLFRRTAGRWVGEVHERLVVAGRKGRLENWLKHETTPDLETYLAKMHLYSLLEAKARTEARRRPRWHDTWIMPAAEVFRRLIWKRGLIDGPAGWAFCFLSGLSQWVLAREHRRIWQDPSR